SVRRLAVTQIWYRITLLSYSGEIIQSDLVSVLLEPTKDIEFTIYPNPNDGNFKIRYYLNTNTEIRIRILNNLGQIIWQQNRQLEAQLQEEALQLSSLPSGSYFIVMQTPKQQWTKTLVVQH
ncbi:MAG: T9SS type A sorting domain-containing protein, partial [Bacteroidia bacterium]